MSGIFLITIGIFALVSPLRTFINLVSYSGVALLLNGIFLVIISSNSTFTREKNWLIAESMVDFVFGLMLMFNPLLTFIVLPLLIGPWMLCIGLLKMAVALVLRKIINGWQFVFAAGCLAVCFGLLIVYNPIAKANGITIIIGAFGIIMGAVNIFDALRFKKSTPELNMMF